MELGHGGPFGAVIVRDGAIVGEGWNEVLSSNDPTAHAEVVAIRRACRERGTYDLSGCEIYSSCEPCPMCLSAIYWSRIGRVYFSIGRHDADGIERWTLSFRQLSGQIKVKSGVIGQAASGCDGAG